MNKNYKVIKINGFRGMITALFVVGCAITGFMVFPGWVMMHIWNYFSSIFINIPHMVLTHGVILWAIVGLTIYGLNNNRFLIGFSSQQTLQEEQIKDIMNKVKNSAENVNISKEIPDISEDESSVADSFDEVRK